MCWQVYYRCFQPKWSGITAQSRFYQAVLEWLETNTPDPEFSPEELTQQAIAASEALQAEAKLTGIEFEGVMCSATKEDMWGLASIKPFIEAGNDVNFEFTNGNKLTLTSTNLAAFEAVWTPFRASFF